MVYVDHDPIVHVHNTALLATDDRVVSVQAAVLHLVPNDDDPEGIIAQYRDCVCAGSHLVLSQFVSDSDPDAMGELRAVAAGTR